MFNKTGGKPVTLTNRDVWDAADALGSLVSQGWTDPGTALRLGKTFRGMREAREGIEIARSMLLKEHSDPNHKTSDGSVKLKDPDVFAEAWRKLLMEKAEVRIFPLPLTAVTNGKKPCDSCKQPVQPNITALHLEALVHIGLLLTEEDELKS